MKVISLGWGVQSFTLAAMVALGELEPVDAVIHADTTHEFSGTYEFAKRWTPWLSGEAGAPGSFFCESPLMVEHPIRVITVKGDNNTPVDKWGGVMIPAFTKLANNGRHEGAIRRQCTDNWKIAPLRRWLQTNRNGELVEQWIGISLDEYQRMKESGVKYIINRWPLIEKRMTRSDCVNWLERHGLELPPKSACVFCPFNDLHAWRERLSSEPDRIQAIETDKTIRNFKPGYELYLHKQLVPIEQVDLRTAEEKGQLPLWDNECSGICGV